MSEMPAAARLEARIRRLAGTIALIGVVALMAQAASIVTDALARWILGQPIHGLEDVNAMMIVLIVATFFPSILVERQNVRVDILGRLLGRRASLWLDVFGHVVLLIFFVLVAWQFSAYAWDARNQVTLILRLPIAPALLGASLILIACVPLQALVVAAEIRLARAPLRNIVES